MATVHLVDAENLVGNGRITNTQAKLLFEAYDRIEKIQNGDTLIIASAHNSTDALTSAIKNMKLEDVAIEFLAQSGKDGADKALLGWVQANYKTMNKRVILGSGDHFFLKMLWSLRGAKFDVQVVANDAKSSAEIFRKYLFQVRFVELGRRQIADDLDTRPKVGEATVVSVAVGFLQNRQVFKFAIGDKPESEVPGLKRVGTKTELGKVLVGKREGDWVVIVDAGKQWVGRIENIKAL